MRRFKKISASFLAVLLVLAMLLTCQGPIEAKAEPAPSG